MLQLGVGTRSRSSMQLRALPLHLLRFCLLVSVAGSPKVSSPVPAQPVIGTTDCSSPFLRFGLPTGCCTTHEGDRHHFSSLCNSSFPTSSCAALPQPAHSRSSTSKEQLRRRLSKCRRRDKARARSNTKEPLRVEAGEPLSAAGKRYECTVGVGARTKVRASFQQKTATKAQP